MLDNGPGHIDDSLRSDLEDSFKPKESIVINAFDDGTDQTNLFSKKPRLGGGKAII